MHTGPQTSLIESSLLQPPGPSAEFLTSHIVELQHDWLGFLTRCAREYGDIVHLRLANMEVYLLNDPAFFEYVLITHHRQFIKDTALRTHRAVYGNGLLTSEGDFWLSQRRIAQPAFHRTRIASYAEVMVEYTEQLLARWNDGDMRDIHQEMTHLALEIVAKTLFGTDVTTGTGGHLRRSGDGTSERGRLFGVDLASENWLYQVDKIIYGLIRRRRQKNQDTGDLLSMLMFVEYDDGTRMSDKQLRDEMITILLAGYETTALSLTWACYLLAQHPEVERRLLDELRGVLGGRPPTVADIPLLPYTEMVMKEVVRLYPPIWGFGREAIQDGVIGGYPIPKGTTVFLSQWVTHRDPRYFPDPDRFLPERWADYSPEGVRKYAYFPFSNGPRLCIGSAFARMSATIILATIIQHFHIATVPGISVTPVPALTLQPQGGIQVTLSRR